MCFDLQNVLANRCIEMGSAGHGERRDLDLAGKGQVNGVAFDFDTYRGEMVGLWP